MLSDSTRAKSGTYSMNTKNALRSHDGRNDVRLHETRDHNENKVYPDLYYAIPATVS